MIQVNKKYTTNRYLLLHLPVAGCKQDTYSVSLLSNAFRSERQKDTILYTGTGNMAE